MHLVKRDDCYQDSNGYVYCRSSSSWYDWVRWVVLAAVVIGFFLLFVMCSCITARRRRRAGRQPFYGTGWVNSRPFMNNNQPNNQYQHNNPAPPYTPAAQGNYYGNNGANQGYYGNGQQQNGIDLQNNPNGVTHPQQAYTRTGGEEGHFEPPPGPPPTKA